MRAVGVALCLPLVLAVLPEPPAAGAGLEDPCWALLQFTQHEITDLAGYDFSMGYAYQFTPLQPAAEQDYWGEWYGHMSLAGVCKVIQDILECFESVRNADWCMKNA